MSTAPAIGAGHGELKRSLSYTDLIVYGLAYIAPTAPLNTLGFVWTESHGLIALAYLLGAVCMYFTAKSYALMTESVPTAGSVYGFARVSLGVFPGFIAGWMILLDYLLIPAFVYVLMAVALGTLAPTLDRSICIVLSVAITLAINWFGITITTRASLVSVLWQFILVGGLVVAALLALHAGAGNGALTIKPLYDADALHASSVFGATSICIMSFLGFDAISTLVEEVKDRDRRVVGRAIIAVLVIAASFFVAVTWVLGNVLPGLALRDPASTYVDLAAWIIGPWAGAMLAWSNATIIGLSNALPMQVGVARVLFAMGRDRQLPAILARVHPRFHTPYVSMVVTSLISLGVALVMRYRMDELATIVNFGALSGFLLLHLSVLKRFAAKPGIGWWLAHRLVPVCGIVVVLAVFSGMNRVAVQVGLSWLAIGLCYGLILKRRHREELHAPL
jgi:amino acid transporter